MKKFLLFIPLMLLSIALSACGSSNEETNTPGVPEQPGTTPSEPGTGNEHYLIVYCSRTNNTEHVAKAIQQSLDCDILEVEPQTAYDEDYNSMLNRAQSELAAIKQGNYPAIKISVDNFDKYDMVFVGYPIWYSCMATPMQAFLHNHGAKLKGKRLALFATSGSSGISTSVSEAKALCPDANVLNQTLHLTSSSLSDMNNRVASWLNSLGAKRENHDADKDENASPSEPSTPDDSKNQTSLNMKITIGNQTYMATLEDNAAAKDLLSRLPLEITLKDFNHTEKIFYPDPALNMEGVKAGCSPVPGDITIYAPWKNIAIFYKNLTYSDDLIKIGHIDGNGIEALQVDGDIKVKLEK